ncbi:MAG: hypothetical protein GC191_08200 [Azospirillum sp.]|nr:hypothetical protein [Azospirillum sp.]
MAERLSGDPKAETFKDVVRPALLAELQFASGTTRAWTGVGTLTWNGEDWLGVGTFGRVSTVTETLDLKAVGARFELSGIPGDLVASMVGEPLQGKKALLYLAFFDEDWQLIPDPVLLFRGFMDSCELQDGGQTATIALNAENRLADLARARVRRYTDADQQAEYPGDLGFAYVASMQDLQILWGRSP